MFDPKNIDNFAPIGYQEILSFRRDRNISLHAVEAKATEASEVIGYHVILKVDGIVRYCNLWSDDPEWENFTSNILPLCNKPIIPTEVRFYTHDFADASTWHGKTCGDPAAPYVGGVALHPLTGLWLNATGAAMMQAYDTPGSGFYQDPSYLYGSLTQLISAQYDDVNFRWVDNLENSYKNDNANFPFTTYCWLDLSPTIGATIEPAVWRDGTTNDIICSFDPELGPMQTLNDNTTAPRGSWICTKPDTTTVDSTSSRWRVDPYDGYKIQFRAIGMNMELNAMIIAGKCLRWMPYGIPSPEQQAGLQAMGLPQQVAQLPFLGPQFVYRSVKEFRFGCNDYAQTPEVEPGCTSVTVSMIYDYVKTVIPTIDSVYKQRFDIVIDDHVPINHTKMARGTFIAVQYPSF